MSTKPGTVLPEVDPRPRTTSHGAKCSVRMARLYNWFGARGIGISDWSTDQSVASNWDALQLAAEFLRAEMRSINPRIPVAILETTLGDMECIMKRAPQFSIHTTEQARKSTTAASPEEDAEDAAIRRRLGL